MYKQTTNIPQVLTYHPLYNQDLRADKIVLILISLKYFLFHIRHDPFSVSAKNILEFSVIWPNNPTATTELKNGTTCK